MTGTVFDPAEHPHRRRNALNGQWVLVSPHRAKRPWLGQHESASKATAANFDPGCYLCPGNRRVNGDQNPIYAGPYVFANDFSALTDLSHLDLPNAPALADSHATPNPGSIPSSALFSASPVQGEARVLCFSPDHSRTLPELSHIEVLAVVNTWCQQVQTLGQRWRWVQVFENKGEAMGCSNPHPHGQIWACDYLPTEVQAEEREQRAWFEGHGQPLLLSMAEQELAVPAHSSRVVEHNAQWLAVVPYWATWPFETLLVPLAPTQHLPQLSHAQREALAHIVRALTARYDRLFNCSFPYSMGWHGAPTGPGFQAQDAPHWQLHAHFYPPLLRSATVRKFMVGFEMLAEAQRDLTPEQAAQRLREV